MTTFVHEEYVESHGARLWTATQGQGDAALVLLHGGPGGSDQLQPVAGMLDDLVVVHRYEQRSCGRSTGDPPYTVKRWLDDLEQLRSHWGHPHWIVFGHSFGAELALAYAAAFPLRARAIVYMSCLPAAVAGSRGKEEFRANRAARIAGPLQARFIELCRLRRAGSQHWTPPLAAELSRIGLAAEIGSPVTSGLDAAALAESTPPVNQAVHTGLGDDFRRYAGSDRYLEGLRQLDRPTLVLHGDRDLRPMWAAERLAERLPGARLVKLPCGHFPWLEAPNELRQALRNFVSEILAGGAPR